MKPEPGKIYHGDALELLPQFDDGSIGAIITDPVWWGFKVGLSGEEQAASIFTRAATHFARLTDRVIVILGIDTDPRPLFSIPLNIPFLRCVWLRRVPATHRGIILRASDIAYVFGKPYLNVKGTRVLPGESTHVSNYRKRDPGMDHPCPRPLDHMRFLVHWYTRPGSIILDPFCGSGTTLIAAEAEGRQGVGIEIDPRWNDTQRHMSRQSKRQMEAFPQ